MTAVILAGGKGTRLRPYTTVLPKPLMPVDGVPILEILIRQLVKSNVKDIVITVGHLAHLIKVYFGNGEQYGVRITYSEETSPLGTIGPLKLIRDLPENFLILNGDILTDLRFNDFFRKHCESGAIFSISSYIRNLDTNLGVLEANAEGRLVGFREKPKLSFEASMGIYAANRSVLEHIPDSTAFGFDDLMLKLLALGKNPCIQPHHGIWLDIGRPEDFERAQSIFSEVREEVLTPNG